MLQTKSDNFISIINLLVSFEVEDPEYDVPAGAAVLQRLDAGADVGGTLHHEHVLLLGVLRHQGCQNAAVNILDFGLSKPPVNDQLCGQACFRKVDS